MILRPRRPHPHPLAPALLLLLHALAAAAQDAPPPFDCRLSAADLQFDLTALAGARTVARTRATPPTEMRDELRFDLCADLPALPDVAERDQVRAPPPPS